MDCNNKTQILDDVEEEIYLLVPKEFGGGHIVEHCYDGYGDFGGHDVYDLIAIWNREYISSHPHHKTIACKNGVVKEESWYEVYSDLSIPNEELKNHLCKLDDFFAHELRHIGICLACYDIDNAKLPYPIKVTHDETAIYEDCKPSEGDPDQGWLHRDWDEDDEWDD